MSRIVVWPQYMYYGHSICIMAIVHVLWPLVVTSQACTQSIANTLTLISTIACIVNAEGACIVWIIPICDVVGSCCLTVPLCICGTDGF